ncbi:MAG: hypothetical protein GF410_00185 [Chitinivibrionales bacterium]|nr:hypothetical protein [Chitinivibrionales bacterium]
MEPRSHRHRERGDTTPCLAQRKRAKHRRAMRGGHRADLRAVLFARNGSAQPPND